MSAKTRYWACSDCWSDAHLYEGDGFWHCEWCETCPSGEVSGEAIAVSPDDEHRGVIVSVPRRIEVTVFVP